MKDPTPKDNPTQFLLVLTVEQKSLQKYKNPVLLAERILTTNLKTNLLKLKLCFYTTLPLI